MSELKRRGRKHFTEKEPQTTIIESADGALTATYDKQLPPTHANNRSGSSLHARVLLVVFICFVFSVSAMGFLWVRSRSQPHKGITYFNTRKSRRVATNAFVARSKPDNKDEDDGDDFDEEGGDDEKDGTTTFCTGDNCGDKGRKRRNLASSLAPLLRDALNDNNMANLGIDSDSFVHGDDEDIFGDGEKEEQELLKRMEEEDFDNRDVPMQSEAKRIGELRQKLALRYQASQQPKVKVLKDINATEFYIAVGQSEPVLITNASQWCTKNKWTLDFIREKAGNAVVGIETSKSNRFYANEGLKKKQMKVSEFLDVFTSPDRTMDYYLAEEGLQKMPELEADLNIDSMDFANFAVLDRKQLWVGGGGQVSPLHHDQWDNILCQVEGRRTFVLYDPLQVDRLYPKSGSDRHFSQVDASNPDYVKFPKFKYARQYRVDVEAGQMIILPAYWWHQVHHGPSVNVGVNYWFVPASLMSELLYDLMLPDGPNY